MLMNDEQQPPTTPTINPQEPDFTPPAPGAQVSTEDGAKMRPPKKSKNKLLLTLLFIILLTAGAAAAYLLYFKKDASAPEPQAQQTQQTPAVAGPNSLIYAEAKSATSDSTGPFEMKSLLVNDKEISTGYDLTKFESGVMMSAVNGEKIALAIGGSTDKPVPTTVLYSDDNGKSYKSIWKAKTAPSSTVMGDQITSIIFSSDGTSVIIGYLPESDRKNQITEISLQGKNTTTLLTTTEEAGAFLYGYDKARGQVIYTTGCYNCGGGGPKKIFVYNSKTKASSTLFESKQNIWNINPNKAYEKLLFSESTIEEGTVTSDTAIKEISLADKKVQTLFTKPKSQPQILNLDYMNDGVTPYYVTEKAVVSLKPNKQTDIFTTDKRLLDVLYMDEIQVIVKTGDPIGKFVISKFTMESKETSQILQGADPTHRIIGVTVK